MPSIDNRRILIVDDNAAIHGDFKKILGGKSQDDSALVASEDALFGDDAAQPASTSAAQSVAGQSYELAFALQGRDALAAVEAARKAGTPFALAFVDMRMPPGWDGVETIQNLWQVEPDLQVVICTAFSDYSWPEMVEKLGRTDRLLILKKPFDAVEVAQLASALTEKWNTLMNERTHLESVKRAEMQARAYASSLETVNRALETSWAKADAEVRDNRRMLLRAADELLAPALSVVADALATSDLERDPEAFEYASENARHLAHALEQFIALARLNGAANTTPPRPVDAPSLVARVVASVDKPQRERIRIDTSHAPAPDALLSDIDQLATALRELVDNALRCSRDGEVLLSVATSPSDSRNDACVSFIVEDHGPGVSRDALKRLFEPFGHAPVDGVDSGGAGLGLALARRIAEALGGGLSYEPAESGGSRFRLHVPAT